MTTSSLCPAPGGGDAMTGQGPEYATSNHTFDERRYGVRVLRTERDAKG